MNYFETESVAKRYEKGRPFFHSNTINKVRGHLGISHKYEKAIDIACGTGLSTKALMQLAEQVFGTDISEEMLRYAFKDNNIVYQCASAENLPFEDDTFDIATVSSGVHWFDIEKFLLEANRVLKAKSWLVLYENFFISEMQDVQEFSAWFPEVYCKRFPLPPRQNNYAWTNENLISKNFRIDFEDQFRNEVQFTIEDLVLYFTTQSNITSKIERRETDYQEVEHWLMQELKPFFTKEDRIIEYGNWIKYLQKID
ncbi:MAG: hypothetical protein RL660_2789 [Bacteroidota bacterium]|jgi:ubiquinone/menaquinone biosynthesis C-methylase UbiE